MAVTIKITVFWGVTSCSLVATFVNLGQSTRNHILETVMLMVISEIISYQASSNLRYSATVTIEAVGTSETMTHFYQTRGLHKTQTFLIITVATAALGPKKRPQKLPGNRAVET
jgi:hypothetical protein